MAPESENSVMIVEDERIVAMDLQQTLTTMGYDAFAVAASADEAISRVSERCPDVVLMDIRIKGDRDGIETANLLRSRFDVPVVYLTAHADDRTVERAKSTEPYGYVLKPVKSAELRSALEVALHRHDLERRLRQQQKWLSTTLESIADAVIVVDLNGRITFTNPAAERLLGVSGKQAHGEMARDVVCLWKDGHRICPFDSVLQDKKPLKIQEATLANQNQETRIVGDSVAPVVEDGEVLGAVMVLQDTTEQKEVQAQLEHAARLASLGTMAAGVAHEINNPLSVVLANASFVQEELEELLRTLSTGHPASPSQLEQLEQAAQAQAGIENAATRAANIVSDLKAFARPETKNSHASNIASIAKSAVRSTLREFTDRAIVHNEIDGDPRGQTRLRMDPTKLEQVLVNILINAAHAIEPGKPAHNQIILSLTETEPDKLTVVIQDTGSGMSSEVAERAFDPFFTTKPVGLGTGLGLSICHGMVVSAGGHIEVESRPSGGTTVKIVLPTVHVEAKASEPAPVPQETIARLLLIDDDELVLNATARSLKGHELTKLTSAEEALQLLRQEKNFDVILCDLKMPKMSGMEFYEVLQQEMPEVARRVVFVTGGANGTKEQEFLTNSELPFLEKPFRPPELRQFIQDRLVN